MKKLIVMVVVVLLLLAALALSGVNEAYSGGRNVAYGPDPVASMITVVRMVAYENEAVFYENEAVTY